MNNTPLSIDPEDWTFIGHIEGTFIPVYARTQEHAGESARPEVAGGEIKNLKQHTITQEENTEP